MEFVYVVKRRDLFDRRYPHGLELLPPEEIAAYVERIRASGFFVERRHAEGDPELQQIIPYGVVVRGGDVFLMRRLSGAGEARLRGKRSIGVGGHVNPVDGLSEASEILTEALRREVDEEVAIEGGYRSRVAGILNDDSTEVGAVHFGLVSVVEVSGNVTIREHEGLEGRFVSRDVLDALCESERETFETWSSLLVDRMDELLCDRKPTAASALVA